MVGAAASLKLAEGLTAADLESWRNAGYAAIDRMVESLSGKISGSEDSEKVSQTLEQESKDVTAAVFEKMLQSLGREELTAKSCVCPLCRHLNPQR